MMPEMGSVKTRKDGNKWTKTFKMASNPTPLEIRSSTSSKSSRVNMTKHNTLRLIEKGVSSSVNMYRSRRVRTNTLAVTLGFS